MEDVKSPPDKYKQVPGKFGWQVQGLRLEGLAGHVQGVVVGRLGDQLPADGYQPLQVTHLVDI